MTHCAELYDRMTRPLHDKFYFSNYTASGVEGGLKYKDNIYRVSVEWVKSIKPAKREININLAVVKIAEKLCKEEHRDSCGLEVV